MSLDPSALDHNNIIAYSIKQLTAFTSISKSQLFNEIKSGNLKVFKCGKRTLATKQAVQEWIDTLSNTNIVK